jgi:tetratricopeptide (TPR) repeat protein
MASPEAISAANTKAVMLKDEGRYDEARDYLHGSLRAARQCLGDEHETTLSIMTNLSALLQLTDKLDEAEPLCIEALELRRLTLGDKHKDTVNTMINLGTLYETRGEYAKAEALRLEVLATRRATLEENDADILAALQQLAGLRLREGRLNEVCELLCEEIAGHVKRFGPNCASYLPQETKTCAAKLGEEIAKLPDKGNSLTARNAFMLALQAALLPKKELQEKFGKIAAASGGPPVSEGGLASGESRPPASAAAPLAAAAHAPSTAPPPPPPPSAPSAAVDDVASLLEGLGLSQYIAAFEEQEMEMDVMRDVASKQGSSALDECLKELGVKSMGHRQKIINALK